MTTHTPGPWKSKQETNDVSAQVWANGRRLAEVYGEDWDTLKANTDLIAAAPDMVEALLECKFALFFHTYLNEPSEERKDLAKRAIEAIDAAIRKASGMS